MSALSKPRVAIIGAGVIGLSVGVCLTDTYGQQLDVTIIADKFSPDTTSDRAGAIFMPGGTYITHSQEKSDDFEKDTMHWSKETFHHLRRLYDSQVHYENGIIIVPVYKYYKDKHPVPWYTDIIFDFKELSKMEAKALDLPYHRFNTIWSFSTFLIKTPIYLSMLMDKFRKNGGLIKKRKLSSLDEVASYDIIINCTGLGARELVRDPLIYPVRGQLVIVKAPNVKTVYYNRELDLSNVAYVMPHKDVVILGGTAEPDNWSTTPDPKTAQEIYQKCLEIAPDLKDAEIVGGWACLRPVRERVRLEVEDPSASPLVIHNYGHGGSGIILSWGCALDTLQLVQQCLEKKGVVVTPQAKL